jgi:hypothetical protein
MINSLVFTVTRLIVVFFISMKVSDTIGLRNDLNIDDQSAEEFDEVDDVNEQEQEQDNVEPAEENDSPRQGAQIRRLKEIIDRDDLLPAITTDTIDETNDNRRFKPFHDAQEDQLSNTDDDGDNDKTNRSNTDTLSRLSIDKNFVRAKVKQTLQKKLKQQHRRLCSKGEAALVTAQRRDQRETIQLHLE